MHNVSLRLDNGDLILRKDDETLKLAWNKAIGMGKLGERDFQRLEQLCATAESLAPKTNGTDLVGDACSHLASSLTSRAPHQGGAAKRARLDGGDNRGNN